MKRFTFKPFRGDKTSSTDESTEPQNQAQRRREQVRRAQKTHRERKEAYVASLESEVVRLRANEARLESETKALYAENNLLKTLLKQQGVPIPAEAAKGHHGTYTTAYASSASPDNTSSSFSDGATDDSLTLAISQEDHSTKKRNRRKQIYIQQPHARQTNPVSTAVNFSQPISPPSSSSTTSHLVSSNNLSPTTTATSPSHIGTLDPDALGTDFVLTLESPCLSHTDVDTSVQPLPSTSSSSSSSAAPAPALPTTTTTGHALTLSACVLHTHPSPAGQRLPSAASWCIPRASLSQLLQLSAHVPVGDDEVTPVQAWDYVRRQQGFCGLEVARWEALKEKLVAGIRCYGFGGVLQRDMLENCVFEAFVVGRVF